VRSDYILYIVAIICFIVGAYSSLVTEELYVYALAVLGLVFLGIGYIARPKKAVLTTATQPPPTVLEQPPKQTTETAKKDAEPEKKPEKTRAKKGTRRTRRRRKKTQ
jgi:hypothetical protein